MVQLLVDCNDVSLSSIFSIVKRIMLLIQIFVPIILLVAASISLMKLTTNPNIKDGARKIFNKFLAAVIIFFIPVLVDTTMNIIGDNNISCCWINASEKVQRSSGFSRLNDDQRKSFFTDPKEYEKCIPSWGSC